MRHWNLRTLCFVIAAAIVPSGHAAEPLPADVEHNAWSEEPMSSEMMREGMVKGDVGKAAKEKAQEMQPMIEQEEQSMSQEKAEP